MYIKRKDVLQFLKFGIVGLSNTLISLLVYYIFIWMNGAWYQIGNAVGWVVSVANAFYWNNKYVFADGKSGVWKTVKKLGKTYLSYGATFLLSVFLLYLEVDIWGWSSVVSPLINLLVTIPLNFLLNKFWTFQ